MRVAGILLVGVLATAGCRWIERLSHAPVLPRNREPPLPGPPTYSRYLLETWQWQDVARVLVLPPRNESRYTRAGQEVHVALTTELQKLGRFEVVAAPPDVEGQLAKLIHVSGRFDEGAILDLAKLTRADVIVFPTVTQYSPYPRPRMGLVLQAVSPLDGKVISSVDGLWDTNDAAVAEQMRTYYRQREKPLPRRVRNHEIATQDSFAEELALDSPELFQRYICNIASRVLIGLPESGGRPMQMDRPLVLPRWRPGELLQVKGAGRRDPCDPVPLAPGGAVALPPGVPAAPRGTAPVPPVGVPSPSSDPMPMPAVPPTSGDPPIVLPEPRRAPPDAPPPGG